MNKDEKAGLWSERIREFRFSGQTCRDWCTEHQIPVSTMTYWIRKLKQEKISSEVDKEPVFAKLPSESEIVMRDTAQETAAVQRYILPVGQQISEKATMVWRPSSNSNFNCK